ncbi:MAG: M48 family metallopeptidase [Spirochaetes bacterium]|nr:M48 family metallopeptidase [Spirochaetota bacterium]
MIRQTTARYFDGEHVAPKHGRLVYDAEHGELHFYARAADGASEKFLFSLDKYNDFELRLRGAEQHVEWRRDKKNQTSALVILNDQRFARLVRDKFLAHKNIFWRFATYIWSESFVRVALPLAAVLLTTAIVAHFAMQNLYRAIPETWDKEIGDQAAAGMADFGEPCESPQTVKDLKLFVPYFADAHTRYTYEIQIINAPIENAFALPGGRILVFSQTLINAKNYAELAGILAHEIGHVEHRHGMQQLSQYMTLRLLLALAFGMSDDATLLAFGADAGALLLILKNSRDHERDADTYAAERLAHVGISSSALRAFFERVSDEHKTAIERIPDFVLTHPADAERIRFFERYEKKHSAKLQAAAKRMEPNIASLLRQKPALSSECYPNDDAEGDEE